MRAWRATGGARRAGQNLEAKLSPAVDLGVLHAKLVTTTA
jgi:hypothetical protein